jgi:DNA-binding transcriptional regulator YiaG
MNGRTAKKIRKALMYDKENANAIQRKTYRTFKKYYTRMAAPYKNRMIEQLRYK